MARVKAIPKRPFGCYRFLELGQAIVTYGSTVDQGQLCYRCGGIDHQAKSCPASVPRCPHCESLGASGTYRMGGAACVPPKIKGRAGFGSLLRIGDRVATRKIYRKRKKGSRVW